MTLLKFARRVAGLICLVPVSALCAAGPDAWLLLDPGWADRVVFYHRFEDELTAPDINRVDADIKIAQAERKDGITGQALATGNTAGRRRHQLLAVRSTELSAHRPLTVMAWWRLDAPMQLTTGFTLLGLANRGGRHRGYLRTFLRGKGQWCNLSEPRVVHQVQQFPGMSDWNDPYGGGRAWFDPGDWHHVAITVGGRREINIYWDGELRTSYHTTGRLFREGDTNTALFGPHALTHPMSLDEVVIVDRVLRANEIAAYVHDVRLLRHHPLADGVAEDAR